jgi:hypothetical protein
MSADDLDANFVLEEELVESGDEKEVIRSSADDLTENYIAEENSPKRSKDSKVQPAKQPKKSKIKGIDPSDLAIDVLEVPELFNHSYVELLDKLYENQEKPLYVKSHTKVKVLIVCSSALRCIEVMRELKAIPNLRIAKLFSKHMKINEQIDSLKSIPFLVGVGTPNRLVKILETDPDALKAKRIEYLIIDGSHKDKKSMTIWNLNEHHPDLKQLYELVKDYTIGVYNF